MLTVTSSVIYGLWLLLGIVVSWRPIAGPHRVARLVAIVGIALHVIAVVAVFAAPRHGNRPPSQLHQPR